MGHYERASGPKVTIVGGQPRANRHVPGAQEVPVPIGIELVLYRAAQEPAFRAKLMRDRRAALDELGVELQPSERSVLESTPEAALLAMIDRIVPGNPRGRRVMRGVAAAVTSLAAGTAVGTVTVACDERALDGGVGPTTWVDGGHGGEAGQSAGGGGAGGQAGGAGGDAGSGGATSTGGGGGVGGSAGAAGQ